MFRCILYRDLRFCCLSREDLSTNRLNCNCCKLWFAVWTFFTAWYLLGIRNETILIFNQVILCLFYVSIHFAQYLICIVRIIYFWTCNFRERKISWLNLLCCRNCRKNIVRLNPFAHAHILCCSSINLLTYCLQITKWIIVLSRCNKINQFTWIFVFIAHIRRSCILHFR